MTIRRENSSFGQKTSFFCRGGKKLNFGFYGYAVSRFAVTEFQVSVANAVSRFHVSGSYGYGVSRFLVQKFKSSKFNVSGC